MLLMFLGMVPLIVIGALWAGLSTLMPSGVPLIAQIILGVLGLISIGLVIFIGIVSQYALITLAVNPVLSKKQALKETLPKLGSLLWISFLQSIITGVGFILFIVPGIIFLIRYSLSIYVGVIEGRKGMNALNRSKEIVHGYGWPVMRWYIFMMLIQALISLLTIIPIVGFLASLASPFIITPLFIIYFEKAYRVITARKEQGFADDNTTSMQKALVLIGFLIVGILFGLVILVGIITGNRETIDKNDTTPYPQSLEMSES